MPHTIKEQVGEKRSTICTHGYANFLLKNALTKHNKYVVNQILEYIDNIGFRIRSFHNSLRNTGFVTRVTLWMPHVEQELFAPVFILSQWVHVVHVVKLFVFTLLVRIVMSSTISALKRCSIRPICFVGVHVSYIMSPLRTKGDILFQSDFFLPLLLFLLSEACPDYNFFFFPDRSIIFGIRQCVTYRNDLRGTLTFDLKVK